MEQHITCPSCGTLAATLLLNLPVSIVANSKPADPGQPEWVRQFVADRCRLDSGARIAAGQLWASYQTWAAERKIQQVSLKRFGMEIALLPGVARSRSAAERVYVGIGLMS